jgi:mRNA interferase MazF
VALGHGSIGRGSVYLVRLDPTQGSEIRKTRPCVIVSPDELNQHLRTVIVAPMTTGGRAYPWRPRCRFQGRAGFVALDQLRTIDAERLLKSLGQLDSQTVLAMLRPLQEMFASVNELSVAEVVRSADVDAHHRWPRLSHLSPDISGVGGGRYRTRTYDLVRVKHAL